MPDRRLGIHLSFQRLWDVTRPENVGDLACKVGFSRRAVSRWKHDQGVPVLSADAVACALGMHPSAIWGDGWDGVANASDPPGRVNA